MDGPYPKEMDVKSIKYLIGNKCRQETKQKFEKMVSDGIFTDNSNLIIQNQLPISISVTGID